MAGHSPPVAEVDFQQVFSQFKRPIYNFFANRGFSKEESLDLTQETFLQTFRSLDRFRGGSSLETWLFAIAKNVWRLHLRRRSRAKNSGQEISLEEFMERATTAAAEGKGIASADLEEPLDRFLGKERARLLREAIVDLPEQMRNCLLLRLVQELKYEEIATVLHVSVGTVKSQLFDARVRLRERLAELFGEVEL